MYKKLFNQAYGSYNMTDDITDKLKDYLSEYENIIKEASKIKEQRKIDNLNKQLKEEGLPELDIIKKIIKEHAPEYML